jgi:catechol 2,3-dioxygenase-like lactoylglutathione lyase family enzyme
VRGALHHLELWVPDLPRAAAAWGWLLEQLGYTEYQNWQHGRSWRLSPGCTGAGSGGYVVVEQSPALTDGHVRTRAGLNHVAFRAGSAAEVDALVAAAPAYGWTLLFADRHPYAGGPDHYAAYLENADGFEVELVAEPA